MYRCVRVIKYKNILVSLLVWSLSGLCSAEVVARLSIVKGGELHSWMSLDKHLSSNPLRVDIQGYGDWTHCEAYSQPVMSSAFVRCFTHPNRTGASIGAYCDLDTKMAWKKREEWIEITEFHLDAGSNAAGSLNVSLDCRDKKQRIGSTKVREH